MPTDSILDIRDQAPNSRAATSANPLETVLERYASAFTDITNSWDNLGVTITEHSRSVAEKAEDLPIVINRSSRRTFGKRGIAELVMAWAYRRGINAARGLTEGSEVFASFASVEVPEEIVVALE